MTKKQELVAGLAKTIEVEPDQIMIYTLTGQPLGQPTAYTVILKDYRKYTGVIPNYNIDPPDETHLVDIQGVSLPAEYIPYYTNPKEYTRADLRDLAAYLQIPDARNLNKNVLVKRINTYKEEHKPQPLSIPEASQELFD